MADLIQIKTGKIADCTVPVPGSKSYTHRMLIGAALAPGKSVIYNPLRSEDTLLTLKALRQLGVSADEFEDRIELRGGYTDFVGSNDPIYLANSGTSMRLLTAVAALGKGRYHLCGSERMHERPIQDLIDGLGQAGVDVRSVNATGCPPLEVKGGLVDGGRVALNCSVSSQYLSALLLIGPCTRNGMEIEIVQGLVSKPYVDMTIEVMRGFGIQVDRTGYTSFHVPGRQIYKSGTYTVETDASNASYFWAAGAITGAAVTVKGTHIDSTQGDMRFAGVLEKMGCRVQPEAEGICVAGAPLNAIDIDMADMPDMVPTLAVVAAFAEGTTYIRNVAHLKAKETDRLGAVVAELNKLGVDATCSASQMVIRGKGPTRGAEIETYNDHRMAMCFAVAGLRIPGVKIREPQCVEKSFPNFWEIFQGLYQ